jgi:hypothetical protein
MLEKFFVFPVTVLIHEQRENGTKPFMDKAKLIINKDGRKYYYLKKKKEEIEVQKLSNIGWNPNDKLEFLELYMDSYGVYTAMSVKKPEANTTPVIEARTEGVRFWAIVSQKDKMSRWNKQSWIEKFMPLIMVVGLGVAMMLMFNGYSQAQAEIGASINVANDMFKNISATNLEITKLLVQNIHNGQITITPTPVPPP